LPPDVGAAGVPLSLGLGFFGCFFGFLSPMVILLKVELISQVYYFTLILNSCKCGLWFVVCGLWFVVCGLCSSCLRGWRAPHQTQRHKAHEGSTKDTSQTTPHKPQTTNHKPHPTSPTPHPPASRSRSHVSLPPGKVSCGRVCVLACRLIRSVPLMLHRPALPPPGWAVCALAVLRHAVSTFILSLPNSSPVVRASGQVFLEPVARQAGNLL
jgi:hypothetical protein